MMYVASLPQNIPSFQLTVMHQWLLHLCVARGDKLNIRMMNHAWVPQETLRSYKLPKLHLEFLWSPWGATFGSCYLYTPPFKTNYQSTTVNVAWMRRKCDRYSASWGQANKPVSCMDWKSLMLAHVLTRLTHEMFTPIVVLPSLVIHVRGLLHMKPIAASLQSVTKAE